MEDEDIKAMLAKFVADTRSTSAPPEDEYEDEEPTRGKVPFHRFNARGETIKRLRADLAGFAEVAQKLQGAMTQLQTDTAASVAAIKSGHDEDILLVGAKFDDALGRTALRNAYNALPEAGRPKLMDQLAAWSEKPDEAPRTIQSYLQPVEAKADEKVDEKEDEKGTERNQMRTHTRTRSVAAPRTGAGARERSNSDGPNFEEMKSLREILDAAAKIDRG